MGKSWRKCAFACGHIVLLLFSAAVRRLSRSVDVYAFRSSGLSKRLSVSLFSLETSTDLGWFVGEVSTCSEFPISLIFKPLRIGFRGIIRTLDRKGIWKKKNSRIKLGRKYSTITLIFSQRHLYLHHPIQAVQFVFGQKCLAKLTHSGTYVRESYLIVSNRVIHTDANVQNKSTLFLRFWLRRSRIALIFEPCCLIKCSL